MLTVTTLLIIIRNQKQPKCPSQQAIDKQIMVPLMQWMLRGRKQLGPNACNHVDDLTCS